MIEPKDLQAEGAVRFYTFTNLHVLGRKTIGACVGVLYPKVVIDRKMETEPGFEALCYHEGTHAYEYHTLTGNLLVLLGLVAAAVAVVLQVPIFLAGTVLGLGGYVWWCREKETRADAVALYGAGPGEYFAFIHLIGSQRTWWGAWCYGRTLKAREARAQRRCARYGWRP